MGEPCPDAPALWAEKDWDGGWTTLGGGCVFTDRGTKDFCRGGIVAAYLVLPNLQVGAELAHQSADTQGTQAATRLGMGARFDLNGTYHLLGYVRRGVENADATDQVSWYASVLFTF